ncbi:MAG: hypothetical protein ACKVVP_23190 [Chloroflexota bacterium]
MFSLVQGATPSIIGIDGYYHIRVAALMREHGPRLDFPWLQLTILSPERYADHHFLFHVLQMPFTLGDARTGAKMASVLFATLGLYISYLFLARNRVRYPFFWLMVMLAASQTFLWRQSMARPQGLFLALMVLGVWAVVRRRPGWFIPIGWAAVWTFDGFPLIMAIPGSALGALAVLWLLSRPSSSLREQWSKVAAVGFQPAVLGCVAAAAGIALGLVTHPYFPRNIEFAMLHLLPKAQVGIELDVRVGGEWYPFPASGFPSRVGPSLALCLIGLIPPVIQLGRRQLPDWRGVAIAGLAVGFLSMTIRSQRIIEYLPPFAVLLCAWSWSRGGPIASWATYPRLNRISVAVLPVLCLAVPAGLAWNVTQAQRDARGAFSWDLPRGAATWLKTNTPAGARVFTPAFDDFPRLFYWNTHNTYLVGLDPTYMTLYDQQLFNLWRQIAQGRVALPSRVIKDRFGADYVYTDRTRTAFVQRVTEDPAFETVHSTTRTLVLRIRPAV